MEERSRAYAGYWRNSLADADWGKGVLSRRTDGLSQVPGKNLTTGVMSRGIADEFFAGKSEGIDGIPVMLRPRAWQTFLRAHWGAIRRFITTEVWTCAGSSRMTP